MFTSLNCMNSDIKLIKTMTENISSLKTNWNKREKLRLLKALKVYGHNNVAKISNVIATKSQEEVKAMIKKLIIKSQVLKEDTESTLNDWLGCESIKKTRKKASLIQQALLFIHLFEKHSIFTIGKYDYRAIYHFLYKLFCGCKSPELSKGNQKLLYELLSEIIQQTISIPQKDITVTLEKLLDKKANIRTYHRKKRF